MNYFLAASVAVLASVILYQNFGGGGRLTPVAQDVVITGKRTEPDSTYLDLAWVNDWPDDVNCRFVVGSLSAVQGDLGDLSAVRDPIAADYGKPIGPRGRGQQRTGDIPWRFYRPSEVFGPNFILRVWHRCTEGEDTYEVQSIMLDIPIRDVFPAQ